MKKTKLKIIKSAVRLFNEKGMTNVRLQHIADKAGISVGNLAYHFPNKRAIIEVIDAELEDAVKPILSMEQSFPHLIDFDNQLSGYYFLFKRFAFYFLDFLEMERAYPSLHIKRKRYIHLMISQIREWMQMNAEKGILKPEIQENQFHHTAHAIWMIITFWLTQQQLRGTTGEDEGAFKEVIWNQLLPLFTSQGLMEYDAIILPQLKYYSTF